MAKRKKKLTVTQQIMREAESALKNVNYSGTRSQYLRDAKRFVTFCRSEFDCRSLEQCSQHIQDYSAKLCALGYTPSTVHTYLAAACRICGIKLDDVQKPIRHTADYIRGREPPALPRKANDPDDPQWSRLVEFQKKVGIRRNELANLRGSDFRTDGEHCYVFVRNGKGAKRHMQLIKDEDRDFIAEYFEGVAAEEKIFPHSFFQNNLNLHSLRAACAKDFYFTELAKLKADPSYAKQVEKEVKMHWQQNINRRTGKPKPFNPKSIQGYYTLRGKNRILAKDRNLPIRYNRLILLYTSIVKLSHWRNSVTLESYLLA